MELQKLRQFCIPFKIENGSGGGKQPDPRSVCFEIGKGLPILIYHHGGEGEKLLRRPKMIFGGIIGGESGI